jgi:two-component system sensor histidine kinase RegB
MTSAHSRFNPELTGTLLPLSQLLLLRWVVTAALPLGALAVYVAAGIWIAPLELSIFMGIALISNGLGHLWARWSRSGISVLLQGTLVLDILLLSLFLSLYGGPANPFSVLFLVHIAVAAMMLSPRWLWSITALCWLGFGISFFVHRPIPELSGHHHGDAFSLHLYGMWFAFVVASSLVAHFVGKLSFALAEKNRIVQSLQIDIAHQQRLAALTTLAAGAAHELSTPLGTILVAIESILEQKSKFTIEETPKTEDMGAIFDDAALIENEVKRCAAIIRRMSAGSGTATTDQQERFKWSEIKDQLLHLFGDNILRIEDDLPPEKNLYAPRAELISALTSLIKNGVEAQNNDSPPILLSCEYQSDSNSFIFQVSDHGEGITPEHLPHIGEPFFTTKPAGKGLGLGLFLVRLFAMKLGGNFFVESKKGEGCSVSLVLPIGDEELLS